jgi:hypothetical protein
MSEDERMDILNQLESGEITADQALQALEQDPQQPEPEAVKSEAEIPPRYKSWWLIPFALGIAGTAAGLGLSQLGGWWWVCAGPLLVASVTVVIVAAATSQSPWVHVRVRTGAEEGYRKINIHLPIPVRLTAWGLRTFGGNIPQLDDTAIDDLIVGLEGNISRETPIVIQVDEGEDGERVEVIMG